MEWYLGCAVDDLVVPDNQEVLDMFPSANDWSHWELSSTAFDPTSKYFVNQTSGPNFNRKSHNRVTMDLFEHQQEKHCLNSSFLQELEEGLGNQETSSCDVSDYQLDDLDMTNQTDEVYLNSSHHAGADASKGPFSSYQSEFETGSFGVFPSDNLFENMIIKSDCDPSHLFGMGSSKYLKTHAFSPFAGGGAGTYPNQFPEIRNNQPPLIKAQYEEVAVSPEFEIMDEQSNEETSCESSILQELESAVTQMSGRTRICFRDALYRLAESSRQHSVDLVLERSTPSTVSDVNLRSGSTRNSEVKTNTIDRAVANLMFSKMNNGDSQNLTHCFSNSSGDSEVPILS